MWFVAIGGVMLIMNLAGIGPVGEWAWGWGEKGLLILVPFGLALIWWLWSDMSGLTQRRAMAADTARREARRQKAVESLGLQKPRGRKGK